MDDVWAEKPRWLLLGIDGRYSVFRLAALHVEAIGVGGPETSAFELVAAREGLHLAPLRLLIPEIDRAQRPLAADRAGRRLGLAHRATVHPGRRYVRSV